MHQAKLPTILGLVLLIVGVAAGVVLVQTRQVFKIAASPQETPREVKITDIKDRSFVVSWITEKETTGFVSYGTGKSLGNVINQKSGQVSLVHYVSLENLKPETTYFFKIGSGKNTFGKNSQPYEVKTGPTLSSLPQTDVIFGTVNTSGGTPASGVVVYGTLSGATTLSSLTDAQGKWTIPLSTARTTNLSAYASYNEQQDLLELFVQGSLQIASARVRTASARPVPPITLGKNHDFTNIAPVPQGGLPKSEINLPEEVTAGPSPQSGFSLEEQAKATAPVKAITLTTPRDKEKINTDKPQFVGSGTPGTTFTIKVESPQVYQSQVTVGKNGNWSWSPPKNISSGNHIVTVSWKDEKGQTKEVKRSFTVLAAGESGLPAFSASPSGSVATKSATPSPSPSPKASPSPTPTKNPTPKPTAAPATSSGVPVAGSLTPFLTLFIMGVVLLLAGFLLPKTKFLN